MEEILQEDQELPSENGRQRKLKMARSEDRGQDRGPSGRRNWFLRNMGLTVFLLTLVIGGIGGWFNNKYATAQNTKDMGLIKPTIEEHSKVIATIPYIEKRVDSIGEDLKEFKYEQRTHNRGMSAKVDKVLEAVLRSNH